MSQFFRRLHLLASPTYYSSVLAVDSPLNDRIRTDPPRDRYPDVSWRDGFSTQCCGLAGRWRIVQMSGWDRDAIDLVEPGFIEFDKDRTGRFGFIAVDGWLDYRPVQRNDRPGVEFTWEGTDEGDQVSGRG
jgi:hypothetical protein